jgi:nucleotide-binding universal stress UspA family protein
MPNVARPLVRTPLAPGFDRILVATDFSLDGDRAIRRAALLPLRSSARLTIVHVLPPHPRRSTESVVRAGAERQLEATEAKLLDWLDAAGQANASIQLRLLRGSPADEIGHLARASGPELIVIGRRGERGLKEQLLGTTAQRVAREARFPVLVVGKPPRGPYRCLVAGFDFSPPALRAAKLGARVIAPDSRAIAVHALRALADRAALRDEALRLRRAMPVRPGRAPWQLVARSDDARSLILDVARRRNADLIAVGSLGRTGLARLLMGSVAAGVLQHAAIDVLIAPAKSPVR